MWLLIPILMASCGIILSPVIIYSIVGDFA